MSGNEKRIDFKKNPAHMRWIISKLLVKVEFLAHAYMRAIVSRPETRVSHALNVVQEASCFLS
jgi:hypothetical protein